MTYAAIKDLKPTAFKRFCGAKPHTFARLVKVLEQRKQQKKKKGRDPGLPQSAQTFWTAHEFDRSDLQPGTQRTFLTFARGLINPHYPLAHYRLDQAYERKGDRNQARAAYQRFLEVWQDAEADLPEVVEAKARLVTAQ